MRDVTEGGSRPGWLHISGCLECWAMLVVKKNVHIDRHVPISKHWQVKDMDGVLGGYLRMG